MYQIISHDDTNTTIGIKNARAHRLIGPSGTDGKAQTFTRTGNSITPTPHPTQVAPLVIGFVRRLTDALASPIDTDSFTCTIEPATTKEYDCILTLSHMRDEHHIDRLRHFIEYEDTLT